MIKNKIIQYLETEKRLNNLQDEIKHERTIKENLSKEIIDFCRQQSMSKINLPDGSSINVHKANSYQSLTYHYLEKKIKEFNRKSKSNFPVDEFICFLKDEREQREFYELVKKK